MIFVFLLQISANANLAANAAIILTQTTPAPTWAVNTAAPIGI